MKAGFLTPALRRPRTGDAFLPADHLLGVVLVQRHAHVSAAECVGDGHGQ